MKKRIVSLLLMLSVSAGMLWGCGKQSAEMPADDETVSSGKSEDNSKDKGNDEAASSEAGAEEKADIAKGTLLGEEVIYYNKDLVPSVEPYKVEKDLSNVHVADRFKYTVDPSENPNAQKLIDKLVETNGFAVDSEYYDSEFFDIYESNRYMQFPSFVTVDSLMHTYHLYFSYLMKHTEKDYISSELKALGNDMINATKEQYDELKGTDWESAALRNLEIFFIGSYLLDPSVTAPVDDSSFKQSSEEELRRIMAAEGVETSTLTGRYEDYSQYKVRGYYDGDEELEKYFRSMMWYGRTALSLYDEDQVKSAVLMNFAIDAAGKEKWESIYRITSFFAGASDDAGYQEFMPVLTDIYGTSPSVKELPDKTGEFESVKKALLTLPLPKVNSIPVDEGDDPVVLSFRFMGQRFTIDAAIMQRLVYSAVEENADGDRRYLPDALDTAAGLGSEKALELLTENGATKFKNYSENLAEVKELFSKADATVWNASLYSGWLNTLRPLLEKKGEGYPSFMQSEEWEKKDLETYAGSYTELKHDTILYAKQIMAEMGGGDDEEIIDDRGYVQPEPVVYSRFIFLSEKTKEGLASYNMISQEASEDLDKLSEIARTLLTISEKELTNEDRTNEEYNFIREYGGYIEHFWHQVNNDNDDAPVYSYQAPCPVVADIATDPNGAVLEIGTGYADVMYVVFPIDGELHLGRGSVFSFYQFVTPISDRLTDEEWKNRLSGGYMDDNWNWVENTDKPERAYWTQSYRVEN